MLPLPQPSAAMVHVCIAPESGPPPAEWPASGANLRLRTTTTPGEVFIRWDDVESKCVGTYELFYHPQEHTHAPLGQLTRKHHRTALIISSVEASGNIIPNETLFTAYVHQQSTNVATGCYSVRWKNIWGQTSALSTVACVYPDDAGVQPYVNA